MYPAEPLKPSDNFVSTGAKSKPSGRQLAPGLLAWYDRHRRVLPWRASPGEASDPYGVWLSEIMLQQTTVAAVIPYYEGFLARWPTVADLAAADLDEVLHAWQGLGYYARARNLHRCAGVVAGELGGCFPDTEAGLRELPGIGAYTAAAIAAIAFGQRAVVVDGNVERVMARLHGVHQPLPQAKPNLYELADGATPEVRPGDYAQAVMDLGATVCTPRSPTCALCPWMQACTAFAAGNPASLPKRSPKKTRPVRRGVAFWAVRDDGAVLLRRRPEKGLLGGMMEVPSTPWEERQWSQADVLAHAPVAAEWRAIDGAVQHTFTHFRLELTVLVGEVGMEENSDGRWVPLDQLAGQALPTVMKKVVKLAQGA